MYVASAPLSREADMRFVLQNLHKGVLRDNELYARKLLERRQGVKSVDPDGS